MTTNPVPSRSRTDYAKKYWWAGAIAVPIVVALIGAIGAWPFGGDQHPSGGTTVNSHNTTTTTTTTNNKYVVHNNVSNLNLDDPNLTAKLQDAVAQLNKQNFAAAAKLIGDVPEDKRSTAAWNNLGVAYAGADDPQRARAAFEKARLQDPTDEAAKANLARLDEQQAASGSPYQASNDILHAHEIPLDSPIKAAIVKPDDVQYFAFATSDTRRDLVDVIIKNESTTLAPDVTIYNSDKSQIAENYNGTAGGDVSQSLAAQPKGRYYVRVKPCCSSGPGNYTLTIRPLKAYDAFEPNDDILHASPITIGKTIEAGIMIADDVDFYAFDVDQAAKLVVAVENLSTTLAPDVTIFSPEKSQIAENYNGTAGGDVKQPVDAQAKGRYYVRVKACCSSGPGNYKLTIRPE
jgi:hypothetical protein